MGLPSSQGALQGKESKSSGSGGGGTCSPSPSVTQHVTWSQADLPSVPSFPALLNERASGCMILVCCGLQQGRRVPSAFTKAAQIVAMFEGPEVFFSRRSGQRSLIQRVFVYVLNTRYEAGTRQDFQAAVINETQMVVPALMSLIIQC